MTPCISGVIMEGIIGFAPIIVLYFFQVEQSFKLKLQLSFARI